MEPKKSNKISILLSILLIAILALVGYDHFTTVRQLNGSSKGTTISADTCNDISKLPPEFSRAERFDGIFFLDLPSSSEKEKIWQLYLRHYQLPGQELPRTPNWTGAEIKSCCRLASLLDVPLIQAAQNVVPVAVAAGDKIESLRHMISSGDEER